jgi:hypothetical protein
VTKELFPMRRSIRNIALVLALAGVGSVVQLAQGADAKVEAEAKKADSDAMDLWLGADFKGAKGKLDGAIKKCGKDKCETGTQAALHRDLGVVLFAMNDKKGGAKEFETAVGIDASVTLGKDYLDNADVKAAWEAAKKAAGGTAPTTTTTTTTTTTATVNPEAEGSLGIEAKTAPIHYVLPIVVTLPEGLDVETVKVSYKTTAMDKYKVLEAKKEGDNFVTKIPCEDTQFQGDIKVYVRAYDADKNEVEHYGTLKKPAIITLVEKMPEGEEAPTFPGGKEPDKCTDKGDCQPGFPCDNSANKKPQGSGCDTDDECDAGLSCVDNENGKKWCYETGAPGAKGPASTGKKIWFGADAQVDLLYISKADDICNDQAWACTKNGADVGIPATQGGIPVDKADPSSGVPGQGGKTSGGPALGTFRVFASLDYFLNNNLALGARIGFAFNGNPTSNAKFFPFHGEARISYFLGKGPIVDPTGLKPYLMASGGMGEFDAAVPDIVALASQNPDFADDPALCRSGGDPQLNCRVTGIKAYRLAGRGFAALGGGFWFMISPKMALNVGLKLLFPIPTFSLGIAPEVGIKF